MEPKKLDSMMEQQSDEIVIDLGEVFSMLWQHLLLIMEAGLCFGALVFLVCTLLIPKKYESSTEVYILNKQADSVSVTYSDLQSGTYLTKDYRELITSLPVMEKVTAQLHLDMEPEELAEKISVSSPTDTRIIKISVEDEDPYMANSIANVVRAAASTQIAQVMDIEAVNVVQKANYPTAESSPARLKLTFIGCVLGAMLAVGVLFVIYLVDDTVKTPDDVETYLGLSVLGTIPALKEETGSKRKARKANRKLARTSAKGKRHGKN